MDQEDDPEILNDYEIGQNEVTAIKDKDVYKQKLKRRASQYKVYSRVIFVSCHMLLPYPCFYGSTISCLF